MNIGWGQLWSNRYADALATLLAVAAEASRGHAGPRLGRCRPGRHGRPPDWTRRAQRPGARRAGRVAAAAGMIPGWPASCADEIRAWVAACTDPFGRRAEAVAFLAPGRRGRSGRYRPRSPDGLDPGRDGARGQPAAPATRQALRAPGIRARCGASLSVLEWACIDSGRWDEALAAAQEASRYRRCLQDGEASPPPLTSPRPPSSRCAATMSRSRRCSAAWADAVDIAEYRGFAARSRHAAGLAALAQGEYLAAYAELSQLFAADGTPLHLTSPTWPSPTWPPPRCGPNTARKPARS